jgi:hypothetical protein
MRIIEFRIEVSGRSTWLKNNMIVLMMLCSNRRSCKTFCVSWYHKDGISEDNYVSDAWTFSQVYHRFYPAPKSAKRMVRFAVSLSGAYWIRRFVVTPLIPNFSAYTLG